MGSTILYLDPWTGLSGDMLLSADREHGRLDLHLRNVVDALGVPGAGVTIVRDVEWGVSCTRVTVHDGGHGPVRHLADMEDILEASALDTPVKAKAVAALRRLASGRFRVTDAVPLETILQLSRAELERRVIPFPQLVTPVQPAG